MKYKLQNPLVTLLMLAVSGCSMNMPKLWPFDEKKADTPSYMPANSTEYQCEGGSKFYVRMMSNGNEVWLILPDREVSLTKVASDGASRYSNGISVLTLNGDEATLVVTETRKLNQCKKTKSAK